jgi:hypothetical protein
MRTFHGEPGKLQLQKLLTAAEVAAPDNEADRTIHLSISGNRLVSILNALDAAMYATGKYQFVGDDIVASSDWHAELRTITEAVRDELSRQRSAPSSVSVFAEIDAYDARLNGTGPTYSDSRAPTGDDYNALMALVGKLR